MSTLSESAVFAEGLAALAREVADGRRPAAERQHARDVGRALAEGLKATSRAPTANPPPLYTPTDVLAAHEAFKANCAPAALAALLGREVMAVRGAFPWFPDRPWTNPTQLQDALRGAGARVGRVWYRKVKPLELPTHGLAVLQVDGPWCAEGVNPRAAYRYTHCVASSVVAGHLHVYDINAGPDEQHGAWLLGTEWARRVMPPLIDATKRATGWFVKVAMEVAAPPSGGSR